MKNLMRAGLLALFLSACSQPSMTETGMKEKCCCNGMKAEAGKPMQCIPKDKGTCECCKDMNNGAK